ncbi:UNVERIFIED_CONTAM: hypothetical protein PYX00_008846 [Menopon gallinae]
MHPLLLGPGRREQGKFLPLHAASKNNLSEFTQRIMSAKLLRVKQVQNQLSETQIQLNELINENRILKNLQKRQEGALRKYEGNHAELPQLIRSHNEEIRTLKASNKSIKAQLKECNGKLKERENELEALRESHNKLKKLSNDKNLLEREKLQKKLDELQEIVKEQDDKIQLLSRKILLESKSYRYRLNVEIKKHKETQKELNNALSLISRLENQSAVAKEKGNWISGALGKPPLKRETRTSMPTIPSKAQGHQTGSGHLEDPLGEESSESKFEASQTPETDFDIPNDVDSSNDAPGPVRDVLPRISAPRREIAEIPSIGGTSIGKSASKIGVARPSKKTARSSLDAEANARSVAEKLTRAMECIDSAENEWSIAADSRNGLDALGRDAGASAPKTEGERESKSNADVADAKEENEVGRQRRNVSKRKFSGEKANEISEVQNEEFEELSPGRREKFISMTKTWNEIREKVQEERMKAERKMKELTAAGNVASDDSGRSRRNGAPPVARKTSKPAAADIAARDVPKNSIDKSERNIGYRTESRVAHELLDGFQVDLRKRNLLRALEAIDAGKEGNSSSEELEDSPRKACSVSGGRKPLPSSLPSLKAPNNEFLEELFGSARIGAGDGVGFDLGSSDGIKTRND